MYYTNQRYSWFYRAGLFSLLSVPDVVLAALIAHWLIAIQPGAASEIFCPHRSAYLND